MSDVIHTLMPCDEMTRVDALPGSITYPCDTCGAPCWLDRQTCTEIDAREDVTSHEHRCLGCAVIALADDEDAEVTTTHGALQRALGWANKQN